VRRPAAGNGRRPIVQGGFTVRSNASTSNGFRRSNNSTGSITRGASMSSAPGRGYSRQLMSIRRSIPSACSLLVDTSAYLHSRWAPLRIHSVLRGERESLRFIVVLRDPVERAVLHWRSLHASALHAPNRHSLKRSVGDFVGPKLSDLQSYLNGSSLAKKVKQEAMQFEECFSSQRLKKGYSALTHAQWHACTTLACNWLECVVGTGLYAPQLLGWLHYFHKHQFLVLDANEILLEPIEVAERISAFLDLKPLMHVGLIIHKDSNGTATVISEHAKRWIQRFYQIHNKQVKEMLVELAPAGGWRRASWVG